METAALRDLLVWFLRFLSRFSCLLVASPRRRVVTIVNDHNRAGAAIAARHNDASTPTGKTRAWISAARIARAVATGHAAAGREAAATKVAAVGAAAALGETVRHRAERDDTRRRQSDAKLDLASASIVCAGPGRTSTAGGRA